jgi:hypothetical protein
MKLYQDFFFTKSVHFCSKYFGIVLLPCVCSSGIMCVTNQLHLGNVSVFSAPVNYGMVKITCSSSDVIL